MIRLRVTERACGVAAFEVSGHAGFAAAGQDIVCAAVSVLITTAVNSCEKLVGIELPVVDDGKIMFCSVPSEYRVNDKVQLLLQSMVFGVEQVADEYPSHVRVERLKVEE